MIKNITSTEKLQQIMDMGNLGLVVEALKVISNPIQKICTSCFIELEDNGGPVDPDSLSIVTDSANCDYHNA